MSDTIREIIIQDFISRLAVITTANGYNTNIGKNVYRVRKAVDPDDLPCCVIWPGAEKGEASYGENSCTMPIRIEGIAEFGSENKSAVSEKILGDLKKCILEPGNALAEPPVGWIRSPDYIDSLVYAGGGTEEYPGEEGKSVGAMISVEVKYTEKIGDPYSQ
jgi:hypothetical protein